MESRLTEAQLDQLLADWNCYTPSTRIFKALKELKQLREMERRLHALKNGIEMTTTELKDYLLND